MCLLEAVSLNLDFLQILHQFIFRSIKLLENEDGQTQGFEQILSLRFFYGENLETNMSV